MKEGARAQMHPAQADRRAPWCRRPACAVVPSDQVRRRLRLIQASIMKGVDYWMSCGGAPSPDKTLRLFSTGRGMLQIRARTQKVCVAAQKRPFQEFILFRRGAARMHGCMATSGCHVSSRRAGDDGSLHARWHGRPQSFEVREKEKMVLKEPKAHLRPRYYKRELRLDLRVAKKQGRKSCRPTSSAKV